MSELRGGEHVGSMVQVDLSQELEPTDVSEPFPLSALSTTISLLSSWMLLDGSTNQEHDDVNGWSLVRFDLELGLSSFTCRYVVVLQRLDQILYGCAVNFLLKCGFGWMILDRKIYDEINDAYDAIWLVKIHDFEQVSIAYNGTTLLSLSVAQKPDASGEDGWPLSQLVDEDVESIDEVLRKT